MLWACKLFIFIKTLTIEHSKWLLDASKSCRLNCFFLGKMSNCELVKAGLSHCCDPFISLTYCWIPIYIVNLITHLFVASSLIADNVFFKNYLDSVFIHFCVNLYLFIELFRKNLCSFTHMTDSLSTTKDITTESDK